MIPETTAGSRIRFSDNIRGGIGIDYELGFELALQLLGKHYRVWF